MERTILHCDMNNFYASVECMLDMSLKGKAVAVGGDVENRHGIILAKNYEYRHGIYVKRTASCSVGSAGTGGINLYI